MSKHNKHHKPSASHRGPTPQPAKPTPQTESAKDNSQKRGAWVRKKITATLLSDAHLGSGVGGQGLHALLARDSQNRPVIWSTHLEGLLREAARTLSGKPEGEREGEADRLFGKAGGSRQQMVFTSLYLVQKESPPSRVWRSTARVSLDARETFDNRAPKGDTLRAIEFVPQCTVFEGHVELPETDVGILEKLIQEVESIGHGRASGAGLVGLSLSSANMSVGSPPPFTNKLIVSLTNLDPLCIAKTATPGNIIPTQPYIPGRTLLGALAAWLIAEGTEQAKQAATLLVNGDVAVSDALPLKDKTSLDRLGPVEVLPAPLSLQSKKPEGQVGNVPWWATPKNAPIRLNSDKQKQDPNGEKLKRPEPDLFVQRIGTGDWETYRPDIRIRLRNGRPEPTQKDPSLFAIEQIAENTQFLTELRGNQQAMQTLCTALKAVLTKQRWLRIGRGGSPVQVEKTAPLTEEMQPASVKYAYLTLTSDLLFRDDQLRWQTRLTQDTAKDLPGWPNGFSGTLTEEIFKPILQEETEIRGFNGTSGLWRLPAVGIRRGSVFKVNAALASELRKLASKGEWLGERTHEGFGRFRIDEEDKLPGVTPVSQQTNSSSAIRCRDDASELVAATTEGWNDEYVKGKESETSPRPSLSQWQDLVNELDQEKSVMPVPSASEALKSRKNPQTAGAAGWKHQAAQTVLDYLQQQPDRAQRAEYARMFVRWLRADRKKQGLEAAPAKREVAQ